jgi:pimeloyl-ACP methyl ester carboxylesterase
MLASHATVLTLDPRGAGASDRPERGYDFPLHAEDALAVLDANGIGRASLVTASRSLNAAVLLVTDDPGRFDRLVAIAPYMELETDPDPPDPERLEEWRTDWTVSSCRSCKPCSLSPTPLTSLPR